MRILIISSYLILLYPSFLLAGGFKLALQGTRQLGMGHTGIGYAQDAATIFFNPAGMTKVRDEIIGSFNLLWPSTSFLEKNTNKVTQTLSHVYTPFSIYMKRHLGKRGHIGLGVYTPFGSGIRYPYAWPGRFILTDINLGVVYFQPTYSLKLNEKLSIGAAYILAKGRFTLGKDLPIQSVNIPDIYGHVQLQGSGGGSGYQLGLYYHNEDRYSMGFTYRSAVHMKVNEGQVNFYNIPQSLYPQFPLNTTFRSSLPLPAEIGTGISFKVSKNVVAAIDINYTYWQSYDYLSFDYSNNTTALTDTRSPRLYQNALSFRGGLNATLPNKMNVRAGAFFDQTPTRSGYVGPELPDNNKIGLTTGLTYPIHQHFKLDIAFLYESVFERNEVNLETNLNGTYKTRVLCSTIGLSYRFKNSQQQKAKSN